MRLLPCEDSMRRGNTWLRCPGPRPAARCREQNRDWRGEPNSPGRAHKPYPTRAAITRLVETSHGRRSRSGRGTGRTRLDRRVRRHPVFAVCIPCVRYRRENPRRPASHRFERRAPEEGRSQAWRLERRDVFSESPNSWAISRQTANQSSTNRASK